MSKYLAVILLLAACACFSRADDVFSARDVQRVKLIVNQQQKKSGLWQDGEETAHAVAALNRLGAETPNKDKVCEELKSLLTKAKSTDAKTVSALVQGLTSLKCKVDVTADLKSGIQFSLNSEILADIHAALTAVIALRDGQNVALREWDLSHVASNVAGMAEDDGTYRASAEGHEASAYYAGLALHVLGLVNKNAPTSEVTEFATNAAKKIENLMDNGRSEDVDFATGSKASGVAAATAVLRGLDTLAGSLRGTQVDVSEAQVRRICSFLVDNKYTRNVRDIYHLLEGLHVCTSNNIHIPVVLSVVNATPASLKVRVTNVLDKHACPATVSIAQVTAATDNSVLFNNVQLQAGAESEYQLASADKWNGAAPGYYNVRFSVTPTGDKFKAASLERITRKVKVLADVKPASVAIWVSESAKSSGDGSVLRATYPGVLSTRLTAEKNHYLYADIGLSGPAFQPSQVFLQLSKKGQVDQAAVFPAVPKKDDKGHYLVKVHLASTEFQESVFGAGEYDVSVIVGDSLLVTSIKWKVAQAQINVEAAPRTDAFADQPEIAHNFRAPEKRPHTVLAMVFTLVILAALAALLIRLLASGALNLQLPSNPQELIFALGFQASLGAILCLYVLYWLKLNIFQALFVLAVVAAPAIYFGNQALKRRHLRTNAHEHKE